MIVQEDLTGLNASDLTAIEVRLEPLQEKIKEEREKLFLRACDLVPEVFETINEKLLGNLPMVLKDLRFALNEIVLGSMYQLNVDFGEEYDIAELLCNIGLFKKNYYYHDTSSMHGDYKFDGEEDIDHYKEHFEGNAKYYDPIAGEEVSKGEFEENLYYTISKTDLYTTIFDKTLEIMNTLEVE